MDITNTCLQVTRDDTDEFDEFFDEFFPPSHPCVSDALLNILKIQ